MQPAPSDTSSLTDFTEIEEDPSKDAELLVLDSLFPVVKTLPGLTREKKSGYYYVHGKIGPSDLESLCKYAGRVGELTLGSEPDPESRFLAPHVLIRIAQLQDPKKPLFPLLHHLRIVEKSASLNFLHLLLSPALKTLEFTSIPASDPCYSSVLSFLECAVHQAPHLSTLILGPGIILNQILDISSRYKNLRCLELVDVEISITDQLLRDIGSLQHLEDFRVQVDGASSYKLSSAIPTSIAEQPLEKQQSKSTEPKEQISREVVSPFSTPSTSDHSTVGKSRKKQQSKATEPKQNSWDFIFSQPAIPSPTEATEPISGEPFCDPNSITTIRSPSPSEWSRCPSPEPTAHHEATETTIIDIPSNLDSAPQFVDSQLFPVLQTLRISGRFSLIENLVAAISSSTLRELFIVFSKPLGLTKNSKTTKGTPKETNRSKVCSSSSQLGQQSPVQTPSSKETNLIRHSIQKWTNSLVKVTLRNEHLPPTFSLPFDVFEALLLRPDMKHLEISGMGIDFMDNTLHRLKEVADSKLEILHLPVHSTAPGISLARLRYIAEACPHLQSFCCRFKHLSNIPISPPLSHQLKELSVANERAHPEKQRSLDIARYLDSIFPYLRSIETHDGNGNNAEQWRFIFDLVKLCQSVRMDEGIRGTAAS